MTLRAIYERRKDWFLNEKGKAKEEEMQQSKFPPLEEIVNALEPVKAHIPLKGNNTVHRGKCITWVKGLGHRVRDREEATLVGMIQERYITHR